jgi:hypothetical protein
MRLTTPKVIHHPLPSRTPPEIPPMSAASPWTIPGDADDQSDDRPGEVQVTDQDDANDDE